LKRHLFYGFLFCPGNGRPFFRPARTAVAHTAHTAAVKTKMKNSTLAAKTIFYPLAWPSFTLRSPVSSINTGNHRFSLLDGHTYIYIHDDVMRPKTRRGFFSFFLLLIFYPIFSDFFPFASLKNQFDEIIRLPCTFIAITIIKFLIITYKMY